MEIRLLRAFEAVARLGSLSAASAELHITQPALSRQLKDLERHSGIKLFDRTGYRLTLTRAGHDFLPYCRKVLLATTQLEEMVRTHSDAPEAQLVVACPAETARHIIAPLIAEGKFSTARLLTGPADDVLSLLRNGACDVAVGTAVPSTEFQYMEIGTIPVTVHFAPDWEPASAQARERLLAVLNGDASTLDIQMLQDDPLYAVEHYQGIRSVLEQAALSQGIGLNVARAFGLPEVAQAFTAQHGGFCLLSGEPAIFGMRSVPVTAQQQPLVVPLHAAWSTRGPLETQIRSVISQLSQSGILGASSSPAPRAIGVPTPHARSSSLAASTPS